MPNKVLMARSYNDDDGPFFIVNAEAELGRLIFDDDLPGYVEGPEGYKIELNVTVPDPVLIVNGEIYNSIDGNSVIVSITVTDPDGNQTVYVPKKGFDDAIIWQEES